MLVNNIDLIKMKFEQAIKDAVKEIEITGVADLQANAPVGVYPSGSGRTGGALRRSITSENEDNGNKVIITFGSDLEYAPYTEFRNSTSKGWMRDTLNKLEAKEILEKHLKEVDD